MNTVLVTGAAGFIGAHVVMRLLEQGHHVIGVDSLNDYYDVNLKYARLALLQEDNRFEFYRLDVSDKDTIKELFDKSDIEYVVHLAAQAGVRYSLQNPSVYMASNVMGFFNVLENCRAHEVKHLVFSSSSSVYGANTKQPFSEVDHTDHPISLYAATKKSNELMAHSYAASFDLPCTGLRYFTVYGPWGRPDMALFKFTKNILAGEPIDVYNHGEMFRDFTYIDDVVDATLAVLQIPAVPNDTWSGENPNPASSFAPFKLYNVGHGQPVKLLDFIGALEEALGKKAHKNFLPLQHGDVVSTGADVNLFEQDFGFTPKVSVEEGVRAFVEWYLGYFEKS